MERSLSISEAALVLGVSPGKLRRWERQNIFTSDFRTHGGHRRYLLHYLRQLMGRRKSPQHRKTITYARVSSHDQKADLIRRAERIEHYCATQGWKTETLTDLASGLNCKRRGLRKLIQMICQGEVERLVLTHRDRLLRFASSLAFQLCELHDVDVVILEDSTELEFEQQLAADVIEIMTVFTAKLYGRRSHSQRKAA